jgi:glycosyltransferase involved in cell wall biosynthesis
MIPADKKPLVTLIIPVYGVERFIGKCADSLFRQTYDNIEFLFVNDCTKDSSIIVLEEAIASKYAHLKDKITIINKEQNEGLPKARKTGFKYAKGDYILHVDSDDWVEHDMVESLVEKAVETDADLIYCDFFYEYSDKAQERITEPDYTADQKADYINDFLDWETANAYTWNKLVAKRVFDRIKICPKYPMHEDLLLMGQVIFFAESIARVKKPLYHYRRDNLNSISNIKKYKLSRKRESALNMFALYRFFNENAAGPEFTQARHNLLLRIAWYAFKYERALFHKNRELHKDLYKVPITSRNFLPLPKQILIKTYLTIYNFYRLFR